MSKTTATDVVNLQLDLRNFRTIPQQTEINATLALIAINPDKFWALTESLLDSGYLPTENIIVLETEAGNILVVKEGNRRIAALKLILQVTPLKEIQIPENILTRINNASANWIHENRHVPCIIYPFKDEPIVDRIVTLTHGKAEKAGRDNWPSVARARHNRDEKSGSEPALDLLEKYLANGKNLTTTQKDRWSGLYPLSVLDEAVKKISTGFGYANSVELVKNYPDNKNRTFIENILLDIGLGLITFTVLRDKTNDFVSKYSPPSNAGESSTGTESSAGTENSTNGQSQDESNNGTGDAPPIDRRKTSSPLNDPRTAKQALKSMMIKGENREKVASLRAEILNLTIEKNPIAFCFLLRSMFEISAKAYCVDHSADGLSYDGAKNLKNVLANITNHLTKNNRDMEMVKTLHGANTELGKSEGILSVTSMNQLVHNPSFSILSSDIAVLFSNIFPLLKAMNI